MMSSLPAQRLAAGVLLLMLACTGAKPKSGTGTPAAPPSLLIEPLIPPAPWRCADGTTFVATFYEDPGRAELVFPDSTRLTLAQTVSASGARYADSTRVLHTKGDSAVWSQAARQTTCAVMTEER